MFSIGKLPIDSANFNKMLFLRSSLLLFVCLFFLSLHSKALAAEVKLKQLRFTDTGAPYYFTHGGEEESARVAVARLCQKHSSLLVHVRKFADEFNIWGRMRSWSCSFASLDDRKRPTSLEQKSLQARRINKSIKEVTDGLNQWIKNSGYVGAVGRPLASKAGGHMRLGPNGHFLLVEFDLHAQTADSTLLRMRTYESETIDPKAEVFSASLYQALFVMISQELFTEAINLEPAELN
jgi:hypothetical protein